MPTAEALTCVAACASLGLMVATTHTRTFTYDRFHTPRAPTAPAMAPAARAGPGGMAAKLAGPDPPGPGDSGLQETPEVASLALPARGAWGGSVYEEYKLVPCSSRPAGVVTRCSGPTPGARELESSSIVQPSPCREHPRARPRRPCVRWKRGGGGTSRGHRDLLRTSPCSDRPVSACRLDPSGRTVRVVVKACFGAGLM